MNTVQRGLSIIAELGLHINDDNKGYMVTSDNARDYVNKYLIDHPNYVIGNALSDNESLDKLEFDICFSVVEEYYDDLSKEDYHRFHDLAKGNDVYKFVDQLSYLNDGFNVYGHMIEPVMDIMTDVGNELTEIIIGLGGNIQMLN